jgi:hypothetical protein
MQNNERVSPATYEDVRSVFGVKKERGAELPRVDTTSLADIYVTY